MTPSCSLQCVDRGIQRLCGCLDRKREGWLDATESQIRSASSFLWRVWGHVGQWWAIYHSLQWFNLHFWLLFAPRPSLLLLLRFFGSGGSGVGRRFCMSGFVVAHASQHKIGRAHV